MSLAARVQLSIGTLELDVELFVGSNEVGAILGPNGSGKTTLLKSLAGLLPLSALDAGARVEVRREIRRHLHSFEGTRLIVTHDPLEAAALADRLVVIEKGRIVQTGSPPEVAERPRSPYVAGLVGLNLFRGQ